MKNYITIENEYFEIFIPESLKDYGYEVLDYSTNKIKEYFNFFNELEYGEKIKGAFLISREDFIKRIKNLDSNANPPSWARGCFYGGETQILLDIDNPYNMFSTLAHETFHLLFKKFVYDKNNMNRIVWLDESLAGNFDGSTQKIIDNGEFKEIVYNLLNNQKLPIMNDLSFSKGNIKTNDYNGYELFKVVGRYLMETNEDLLGYINDENKVLMDGNNILKDSLNYFRNKYNKN